MVKPPVRTKSIGTKVSDEEYAQLEKLAQAHGQTLGEWCRDVMLEHVDGRKPSVIEETLLAEVLALRTILLNLHFTVAKGEAITAEGMQEIIERADAGKTTKAAQRLAAASKEKPGGAGV
jgi:hypothetical protein